MLGFVSPMAMKIYEPVFLKALNKPHPPSMSHNARWLPVKVQVFEPKKNVSLFVPEYRTVNVVAIA